MARVDLAEAEASLAKVKVDLALEKGKREAKAARAKEELAKVKEGSQGLRGEV